MSTVSLAWRISSEQGPGGTGGEGQVETRQRYSKHQIYEVVGYKVSGRQSDIDGVGLLVAEQLQVGLLVGQRLEGQQQLVRTANMAQQKRKVRMNHKA